MRIIFEEYTDVILTIVGGLMILSIIIGTCLQTKVDIMHSEELNKLNPILEKIETFECKDVLLDSLDDYLLKDVKAISNTGKDLKDRVVTKIINKEDKYYIEYILKYNNEFMIKRVNCYIKEEEENNENNV